MPVQFAEAAATAAKDAQAVTQSLVQFLDRIDKAQSAKEGAQIALETIREAFGWSYVSCWVIDPKANSVKSLVDSGPVSEEFRRGTREAQFREGEGPSGRTWKSGYLVFVPDLGQVRECSRAPAAQRAGIKSAVCLPIFEGEKVVGTMEFMGTEAVEPGASAVRSRPTFAGSPIPSAPS